MPKYDVLLEQLLDLRPCEVGFGDFETFLYRVIKVGDFNFAINFFLLYT